MPSTASWLRQLPSFPRKQEFTGPSPSMDAVERPLPASDASRPSPLRQAASRGTRSADPGDTRRTGECARIRTARTGRAPRAGGRPSPVARRRCRRRAGWIPALSTTTSPSITASHTRRFVTSSTTSFGSGPGRWESSNRDRQALLSFSPESSLSLRYRGNPRRTRRCTPLRAVARQRQWPRRQSSDEKHPGPEIHVARP